MCTLHLRSELLQRAELQLLHCSFALPKLLGNLPNTPLLDETTEDYAPLICWKFFHQAKQPCSSLHRLLFRSAARFRRIVHIYRLDPPTLPLLPNGPRLDTEKTSCQRDARP